MGFWAKLFGRKAAKGDDAPPAQQHRPVASEAAPRAPGGSRPSVSADRLSRLERLGKPGGADVTEAVGALRLTEGTPEQTAVLQVLLRVLPERGPDVEPLRVACAGVLVQRGQSKQALDLVRSASSVQGMMLAAELHASSGDLAHAVSTIERVLARAIDTPGARERHERWCDQLGRTAIRSRRSADDGATVVAPSGPKTPFRLLQEVARGGAGTVYQAEDELLGRRLAFKVYHRAEQDREQIEREARRAIELTGPGVIRVFDADPSEGWLAIEWLGHGSLRDILRTERLAELSPLSRWLPALVHAVARVHRQGLVHADLKPGNVLFRAPDDPVLTDFGICRRQGEDGLAGTPGYLAPERLAGGPADSRDDVYAIGRILEDVLNAFDHARTEGQTAVATDEQELARHEQLAQACLQDAATRPRDAAALLTLLGG
jgi:hypothetical protein